MQQRQVDCGAPVAGQAHFLEDFAVDTVYRFGDERVCEDEIISFGEAFDMLPFHVDADLARDSPFGGLVASGWHTSALMMRMLVKHFISTQGAMGSPGVDELRWLVPVRPEDRLRVRLIVASISPSRSKTDRGLVRFRAELLNQEDRPVLTAVLLMIYRSRASSVQSESPRQAI